MYIILMYSVREALCSVLDTYMQIEKWQVIFWLFMDFSVEFFYLVESFWKVFIEFFYYWGQEQQTHYEQ
jgi:hypothetical protein